MKAFITRSAALAIAAIFSANANATLWEFTSNLLGTNEVPPNGSPAAGMSTGTYDDVTNMFMMDTVASGFTANVTAAHIHNGPAGVAGPVVFPLSGTTGSTSYTSHDMFNFSEAQEALFLADNYYVNIHSVEFPGGEVRGQLNPTVVPEPATVLGLLVGTGLLLFARKRR
ncbi:MAG: CHRD domain-containing protein [Armatimonadota bacterium]|nr:CHRD domain-containing protein [Armatimonadota bacterium]